MNLTLFGGRLKINLLFIPICAIMCFMMGTTKVVCFISTVFVHEIAHALAASALGVRIEMLEFMPFGCVARMAGFTLVDASKQAVIAAAGPAVNILAAAFCYMLNKEQCAPFISANIALAALNLLPALPLDGGRIFSSMLAVATGEKTAVKISCALGIIVSLGMLGFGVYTAIYEVINPTYFLMGVFIFYSAFVYSKSNMNSALAQSAKKRQEILNKRYIGVKNHAVYKNRSIYDVAQAFDSRRYNIIHVLDNDLKVINTIGEGEVIDGMIKHGVNSKIGSII